MSRLARCILALGAAFLAVGALSACGGGEVVARVGSASISKASVDHWVFVMTQGQIADGSSTRQHQALQQRAMSFLISFEWTAGEAVELGVTVTDGEAQKQLELLKYDEREGIKYEGLPTRGELPVLFAHSKKSHDDRLWLMKLTMLTARVEQMHLAYARQQITHIQIVKYYNEHARLFIVPERRDLEWIVTYSASSLSKAMLEIRQGKNFLDVARRVSLDPPTIEGLELRSAEEKTFAEHIFAAKPHVLSGPFLQTRNHYAFEVTKVIPARLKTLTESEGSIRQRLAAQWVSVGLPEVYQRKWAARTSCRQAYVVSQCRGTVLS